MAPSCCTPTPRPQCPRYSMDRGMCAGKDVTHQRVLNRPTVLSEVVLQAALHRFLGLFIDYHHYAQGLRWCL